MTTTENAALEFSIFLVHKMAGKWQVLPSEAFWRLDRVDAIDGYILPCYDVLHTLGSEYLVQDLDELVREREAAA